MPISMRQRVKQVLLDIAERDGETKDRLDATRQLIEMFITETTPKRKRKDAKAKTASLLGLHS